MTTPKLNGAFQSARNALAEALTELAAGQIELGELLGVERKLSNDLEALALTFKATDAAAVTRKSDLRRQLAEVKAGCHALGSKVLPKCCERISGALTECVEPYREELMRQIQGEKDRLLAVLRDYYKLESRAVEVAEHSDRIAFLIAHLRVTWAHHCDDQNMAELILSRMDAALSGQPLVEWPPKTQGPE
jgi:hypothetical protein